MSPTVPSAGRHLTKQMSADPQQMQCPVPVRDPTHPAAAWRKACLALPRGFLHTQRRGTEGPSWVLACWLGTTCSVPCGEVNRPPELPVLRLQLLSTALGMWTARKKEHQVVQSGVQDVCISRRNNAAQASSAGLRAPGLSGLCKQTSGLGKEPVGR